MLDVILEAVPPETLQNVAAAVAMVYNDVDSLGPPPSLLRLRIALREKNWEHVQEQGQEAQTDQEQDGDDREPPKLGRRLRRQLSTIPSQVDDKKQRQSQRQPGVREMGVQTSPRRRQGKVPHRKYKTRTQMEREQGVEVTRASQESAPGTSHAQHQTGARRRVAAEEAQDERIRAEDDWRQWLPPQPRPTPTAGHDREGGPREADTQPYYAPAAGKQSGQGATQQEQQAGAGGQDAGQSYMIVNPNGTRRAPDSYERQWLQEYTEAQEEEDRIGDLLADLEEEAIVEQARQEYDEERMKSEMGNYDDKTASDSS